MTFRATPDEAVEAGAPASPYLMRNLRDNDEATGNANESFAAMLDNTTGHVHGVGTRTLSYNFTDYVKVVAGQNDRVPFRFGGGSVAAANFSSTLDPDTYSLVDLAAEIQSKMRASAGTSSIVVFYDLADGVTTPLDSATRGLFVMRHTGSSDSPNTRVFELHFATGTGAATGIGPSIGFPKLDQKKAFAYRGDSGFHDGYEQDRYTPTEGGLLGTDAWVAGAFTTVKLADNVIETRNIQDSAASGSAGGDKIHDNTLDGDKTGAPATSATASVGAGSTHTFSVTMPNGGAARSPMAVPFTNDVGGCAWNLLSVESATHTGSNIWDIVVKNNDTSAHVCFVVAY